MLLYICVLGKQFVSSTRQMRGSAVEVAAIAGVTEGTGEGWGEDRS